MFSFASKNKPPRPGHSREQSSSYLSQTFSADTAYHGSGSVLESEPTPPAPVAAAEPSFSRPLHHRAETVANTARHSPPAPLITNFSKPTVYPQEPNLPASVFDPITDLDFELSPPSSPAHSPSKDRWSFLGSFKPTPSDAGSPTKSVFSSGPPSPSKSTENRASRIADWFQGESAPINIGVLPTPSPTKESPTPMENISTLLPDMLTRKPTMPAGAKSPHPAPSAFSLFSKPFARLTPPTTDPHDELLSLDPKTALLPESAQTFSPAAFKNLQQKAEGLLAKMQAAYKERVSEKLDAAREMDASAEELEEANTRATHLKRQLDDLSAKNAEQNDVIASLVEQLAREKAARREDAASRTLRIVDGKEERSRRRPRTSCASTQSSLVSDSGFESNDEGDEGAWSKAEGMVLSGSATPASLVGGGEWKGGHGRGGDGDRSRVCENCRGRSAHSRAPSWALLSNIETENERSSEAVRAMEGEIDKCLEMVEDAILGLRM
ncbi:MAG: hypothetical protein MMC23_000256 [Stictis urceolatum]|nr:hypothetical protein [Stictis urceolata]